MRWSALNLLKNRLRLLFAPREARRHALVGSPALWMMKRDFQIAFLQRMGLQSGHVLLDLGCGTLRGGIPLIEYLETGHYIGLDVRAEVLDQARLELADAGLATKAPRLLHAPALGGLDLGTPVDVVWAFSVLIHMEDAILDETMEFVARHLREDGRFYANVNVGDGSQEERWDRFPVVTRHLAFYGEAGARHGLQLRDLGPLSSLGHVSGDPAQDAQRMLLWGWQA